MNTTASAPFERTVRTTNTRLEELKEEMGLHDHQQAYHALRAVPHALRDRLTVAAALTDSPGLFPEAVAWGIFKVLGRHVSAGEIGDIQSVLPHEIRALWPGSEALHGVEKSKA